jgi:beta-N-acetylhexosaminidase
MTPRALPIWITIDGCEPSESLKNFLLETSPYGIILFARHLKSYDQVKSLISFIKAESPAPTEVALDQEGGRVNRLSAIGFNFESAAGCLEDTGRVKKNASEMAKVLSGLGFDVDFAPVVDLGPAEPGTGLEGRVFSSDKAVVAKCAAAFLDGLKEHNIKGCLKHFPGLGGSKVDSHKNLPVIAGSKADREAHLYPYENLDADYLMVAHGSYEFLEDPSPSTLNPEVYALVKGIRFSGKIVTDDLKMGALSGFGSLESLAVGSLNAGADIALFVCPEDETREVAESLRK